MNIMIGIFHPAHVYNFQHIYFGLKKNGHNVEVVVAEKDRASEIMDRLGMRYTLIASSTGNNTLEKSFLFLQTTFRILKLARKFRSDVLFDRGLPMFALSAFLLGKKHIVFDDTEIVGVSLMLSKVLSRKIITPQCFLKDLGKKHIRLNTFKELFYLHPNYFQPDPSILEQLNVQAGDKYTVLRFVSWNATHDVGHHGISNQDKMRLIKEAEKFGKVFISSEKALPAEFHPYILQTPVESIHSVLYYASLFVGDGGTMTSEAALLGTHAISLCNFKLGTHTELARQSELMQIFLEAEKDLTRAIEKINELLCRSNLKQMGRKLREKILADSEDGNSWIINFIQNTKEA